MSSSDDEYLPLGKIPAFLKAEYGFTVTRATANNWATVGVGGNVLPVERRSYRGRFPLRMMASKTAIRDFVGALSPVFVESSRRRAQL